MKTFSTVNPATGNILKHYEHLPWSQVDLIIAESVFDFNTWRKTKFEVRAQVLNNLANSLRNHKRELAAIMNEEMGKLVEEAKAEVEKSAATCEFYAQNAAIMLKNQSAANTPYSMAEVSFQPLGPIFCIMPWNFPLWQMIRFAAPALMAGNTIVLKHADLTAGTAVVIDKIFSELTPDFKLLRNSHVDHETAAKIIADPRIQGVTFTGSSRGGRDVAVEAAKNLKKIVLELGGSDAYLILEDADIEKSAATCAKARLVNCGQSCVAGKRFIVQRKVAVDFIHHFVNEMKKAELAPLAHHKFQQKIIHQVEQLKALGGKVICGGSAPQGPGAYYPATVIVFEKDHPDLHHKEVFGPVASVVVVESVKEALDVANSSPYGLGGGIFTQDIVKGKELIEKELQAGFVVVNDYVKSDAHIPFGGIKQSGYGRELGAFGILEFVNIKTVAVAEQK